MREEEKKKNEKKTQTQNSQVCMFCQQHPELYRWSCRCLLNLHCHRLSKVIIFHILDKGVAIVASELPVLRIILHVPAAVGGAVVEEGGGGAVHDITVAVGTAEAVTGEGGTASRVGG